LPAKLYGATPGMRLAVLHLVSSAPVTYGWLVMLATTTIIQS